MTGSHHPPAHAAAPAADGNVRLRASRKVRIALGALLLPLVVLTVASAVLLWPEHRKHETPSSLGPQAQLVDGTVINIDQSSCSTLPAGSACVNVSVHLSDGPEKGGRAVLSLAQGPGQPDLHDGDKIVVGRTLDADGTAVYYFSDLQRKPGLIGLGIAFAVLVVLVGRWRGIGALAGLVVTYLVITQFLLPSILDGHSAVMVALTGGAVIVLMVLYIAHGFSARTTTAVIGTLASMVLTGALATAAVKFAHLTGLSSEEATYVQSFAGNVNLQGLILGGIVLGSLGVLNDMTVTQASAVWEIHLAQPARSRLALYRSGMRVGRDHIASTVYTLVLAYTGAALPLLILFTLANRNLGDVASGDLMGEEVVRTLVGGIGLVLSVPITTALAAIVAKSQPVDGTSHPHATAIDPDEPTSDRISTTDDDWNIPARPEARPNSSGTSSSAAITIGHGSHEGDGSDGAPEGGTTTVVDDIAVIDPNETAHPYAEPDDEITVIDDASSTAEPIPSTLPPRRGLLRRRHSTQFEGSRKMGRRERKFWEED